MMKKRLKFIRILLAATLCLIILSCSSKDDVIVDTVSTERTKIIMEIPTQDNLDNYNWNKATLVWSQEFDPNFSLKENWVFENNYVNPDKADQLQTYTQENVEVSNGILKIYAKKIGLGHAKGDYTSSRISGKSAFKYGRIEIRAKLPEGEKNGIWSKLALIGDNENIVGWPDCGELDLMEYLSYKPNETYILVHTAANNVNNANLISKRNTLETAEEEFHAYGILWTRDRIKFYIDDTENIIYTLNRPSNATESNWPFDEPFYILIDMVVGGRYSGFEGVDDTIFPAVMEIDYIRVYHAL